MWLRTSLCQRGVGIPEQTLSQLDTLDADAECGVLEAPIFWCGHDFSFSITEITDLGALAPDMAWAPAAGKLAIIAECRTAWNWLNYVRFPAYRECQAKDALESALALLEAPVDV